MAFYVIVPGIGGSGPEHWQTRWEQGWGRDAARIAPESWDEPDLTDWIEAISRAAAGAAGASRVVVVAHSLGCWAVAEWLRRESPAGVSALLVAPPDPRGDHFPASAAPSFAALTALPVPGPALVVASGDDPYCDVSTSQALAGGWGARWQLIGDYGHINADSGLGDWPQGKALLRGLAD